METRTCNTCKAGKPLSEFSTHWWRGIEHPGRKCKKCASDYARNKKLGVTTTQVETMRVKQDNRCAICGTHADEIKHGSYRHNPLVVDHDHKTGKFRGLLCPTCNLVLGHAQDDTSLLSNAITYLESGSQ
jgi:hypothetical protein